MCLALVCSTVVEPQRILLLQDDQAFERLVRTAFTQRGYTLDTARRMLDGIALQKKNAYTVLLIDGVLPDGSGTAFVEQLGRSGQSVPVIFLASFDQDKAAMKRLRENKNVARVLHKPIRLDALIREVDSIAGRKSEDAPVENDLRQLVDEYALKLSKQWEELRATISALTREPANPVLAGKAQRLAASIHGTAGSFGFRHYSKKAAAIESALAKRLDEAALLRIEYSLREEAPDRPVKRRKGSRPVVFWFGASMPEQRASKNSLYELKRVTGVHDAAVLAADTGVDAMIVSNRGEKADVATIQAIRLQPVLANLPIGSAGVGSDLMQRAAAVNAGASVVIERPNDVENLTEGIEELFRLREVRTPKALWVGHDADYSLRLQLNLLRQRIGLDVCTNVQTVFEKLSQQQPELIVLDGGMAGIRAADLCRSIRASVRWKDVPIVWFADEETDALRIQAFSAGADDYMLKSACEAEVAARVRRHLQRYSSISSLANTDTLTGLSLRRQFVAELSVRLAEAGRLQRPLSVTILDIDHFKAINDEHGHAAGDQVLAALGQLLRKSFRIEDLRARWGGEEFVLAFPGSPAEMAKPLIDRIRLEFSAMRFEEYGISGLTFSAGIAAFPPDGKKLDELIEAADKRLYEAKEGGRNRVIA